ncbi:MAG: hypothetical protein M1526_00245 [Candidatus Thermoplasmatota archaeon]|nr:hypothetical protein [Candidatus Thermoplasmatota archaeon]
MPKSFRLALAVGIEPTMSPGHPTFERDGTVALFQFPGKQKSAAGVDADHILFLRHSSPE